MKGDRMKKCMSDRGMGLFIAAMVFLFTLTTVVQAEARQASLKSQLRQNGISMKLVKLDRTDGFMFGLSITGPQGQSVVLAPGFNNTLLAETAGSEMTLQSDSTGQMQIIQADGTDWASILCYVEVIIGLLRDLSICTEGDVACQLSAVIGLVTDIISCSAGDTSTTSTIRTTSTTSTIK